MKLRFTIVKTMIFHLFLPQREFPTPGGKCISRHPIFALSRDVSSERLL
jgi:hypothetical protein